MGVTSLLSDAGHEMSTALLPRFFAVLGLPAATLGTIIFVHLEDRSQIVEFDSEKFGD
jgi:hypothetical protein